MFPRLKQHALARLDVVVELATLGEYGLDERGEPMPLVAEPPLGGRPARVRDGCARAARSQPGSRQPYRAAATRS